MARCTASGSRLKSRSGVSSAVPSHHRRRDRGGTGRQRGPSQPGRIVVEYQRLPVTTQQPEVGAPSTTSSTNTRHVETHHRASQTDADRGPGRRSWPVVPGHQAPPAAAKHFSSNRLNREIISLPSTSEPQARGSSARSGVWRGVLTDRRRDQRRSRCSGKRCFNFVVTTGRAPDCVSSS